MKNILKSSVVAIAIFGLISVQVGFAKEGQDDRELKQRRIDIKHGRRKPVGELEIALLKLQLLQDSCPNKILEYQMFESSELEFELNSSEIHAVIDQLKENSEMRKHLRTEIVEATKNVKHKINVLREKGPEYNISYYLGLPISYVNYYISGGEIYDPAVKFEEKCDHCEEIYNGLVELLLKE